MRRQTLDLRDDIEAPTVALQYRPCLEGVRLRPGRQHSLEKLVKQAPLVNRKSSP